MVTGMQTEKRLRSDHGSSKSGAGPAPKKLPEPNRTIRSIFYMLMHPSQMITNLAIRTWSGQMPLPVFLTHRHDVFPERILL